MLLSRFAPTRAVSAALSPSCRALSGAITVLPVSRFAKSEAIFKKTPSLLYSSSPRRFSQTDASVCTLPKAIKGAADAVVTGARDVNTVESVKHILEMANRALSRREAYFTDFLNPLVLRESMIALEKLSDVKAVYYGGYPEAERCRISAGHPNAVKNEGDVVAALSIAGNFSFQSCKHGDILGSILGTGIVREKVGDIIVQGEKGAQVLIVPELVDFVISTLEKVGNVSVSCVKMPLDQVEYEPPTLKTIKSIESSVRLDALASAGFKVSRTKLVDLIRKGDVRVNWNTVLKSGTTLKTGDIISVSGKGRLKIGEINTTKKGKYAVELFRYMICVRFPSLLPQQRITRGPRLHPIRLTMDISYRDPCATAAKSKYLITIPI